MENIFSTEVVLALIGSLGGGVAFIVKYILNKRDEERKRRESQKDEERRVEMEERNRQRQEIRDNISDLEKKVEQTQQDVKEMQALIIGCEHDDCPNRPLLKEFMLRKRNEN